MNYSHKLQPEFIFDAVSQEADKLSFDTYTVGGFVRDLILERPCKDIDFVCVGDGVQLAEAVANRLGPKVQVTVFKNFGTASIHFKGYEIEFVGARKESYRSDSRKPDVSPGTLEDDQKRRDFTINALAIQVNKQHFGELIDPFNGVKALKRKIIKTPLDPAITFSDDPLRMMRAVRFASQLKFDIDPDTFESITNNVSRLSIISKERIIDELNKIVLSPKPSYGFKLLFHAGLLQEIFPEMVDLHGVEVVNGKSHKDNFYHTLQVLDNVAEVSDNLWLRWAAILHDIAKPKTKRYDAKAGWTFHGHEDKGARMVPGIFKRLKLPLHEKMRYVQKLVRLHLRPIALVKDNITDSAIRRVLFEAGEDIEDLMMLCKADITSKNHDRVRRYISNFEKVQRKMAEVEEKDHLRNFQPPVSGEKIMEVFGLKPCRIVGDIKEAIKEAILEGEIKNNYEQAFQYMLKVGKEKGLEIAGQEV